MDIVWEDLIFFGIPQVSYQAIQVLFGYSH